MWCVCGVVCCDVVCCGVLSVGVCLCVWLSKRMTGALPGSLGLCLLKCTYIFSVPAPRKACGSALDGPYCRWTTEVRGGCESMIMSPCGGVCRCHCCNLGAGDARLICQRVCVLRCGRLCNKSQQIFRQGLLRTGSDAAAVCEMQTQSFGFNM